MAPISFGVELEFNLAYLKNDSLAQPPDGESRTVKFPIATGFKRSYMAIQLDSSAQQSGINQHIAALFNANNLGVNQEDPSIKTMHSWQITEDTSLDDPTPEDSGGIYHKDYVYSQMEVISPALEFNQESLDEVEAACNLLKENYVVGCNDSTGTHVHTGRFSQPVPFSLFFLKKLIVFLYAFEPQITSIHEPRRINGTLLGNIRDRSNITFEFQKEFGTRPSPSTVIFYLLQVDNLNDLIRAGTTGGKFFDYNFGGLMEAAYKVQNDYDNDGEGHTIEFRQHAGTLDGEAITMWIRVLAGIINFIEDVSPESFTDLITKITTAETWEKEYDGWDEEREKMYGPVPADGSFTIVDLLNHIGLPEEARYYSTRWRIHTRPLARDREYSKRGPWDFEKTLMGGTKEFNDKMRTAALWTEMTVLDGMNPERPPGWKPRASYWPKGSRFPNT